jgi:hypothetical protein
MNVPEQKQAIIDRLRALATTQTGCLGYRMTAGVLVHIVAACAVLGFAVVAFGALLGIRP